eukprot:TRINITY_DN12364_c0_g3_i1.p1 TRINITY_DN12364_c0_g3~~TRINITY_DN12364_c0_g3_i1.p1  ORF type:complete len:224 (+),score=33.96 TRINITY_DN12364_c0_g3_i1:449-1120(+)
MWEIDYCVGCKENLWNCEDNHIYSVDVKISEKAVKKINSAKDRCPDKKKETIKFSQEEAKDYYMPKKREVGKKLGTVTQLLDLFFAPSEMEGYRCDFCGNVTTCIQQFYIKDIPKFLVLYLKRYDLFSNPVRKVKASILNEFDIDIGSFVISTEGKKNCKYELYAVVEHLGSLRVGHYLAYIKSPKTDKWFLADDSNVCGKNSEAVMECNGFLLFYKLKEPLT